MKKLKQILDNKLFFQYFPLILFLVLVLIAQIDAVFSSKGLWSLNEIDDPYVNYYQNSLISNIQLIAIFIDCMILLLIFLKVTRLKNELLSKGLMFFLLLGVFFIWFELWYGSTFYYGEVRDKQGLPLTLNNIGIVGSILFLLYFLLNIKLFIKLKTISKIGIVFIVICGHWVAVKMLEIPWNFVSS
ncbi:hypothetical protein WDW89_16135 [Deltaproteobacteria bacterium TL4]